MGMVGGLMLGLGGALLLEMMEQRLRTVDEISKLLSPTVPWFGSTHFSPSPVRWIKTCCDRPG